MIAWQSMEEDGYEADLDRLFAANLETGEKYWLSEGWDYNVEDINWTADGETIYFTSPYRGTTQVFNINLASKAINQVSSGKFDFGPISLTAESIVSGVQSMSMALEICTINPADGAMNMVTSVNGNIYDNIRMGNTEERYIRTKDNKDLQMWIIYPPDFDSFQIIPHTSLLQGGSAGTGLARVGATGGILR
ncbi:MAG: hypothetical protein R2744_02960 [Bacteroidales bacterium]